MKLGVNQKGLIFLWIAILCIASANSIIRKLGDLGADHLINNHHPISFCNILFVGNLVGGIIFLIIYQKSLRISTIKQTTAKQWNLLTAIAMTATILGPVLFFFAIMTTYVINVVLISSTELTWTLVLGYLIFGDKPSRRTLLSTFVSTIGVILIFALHQPEDMGTLQEKLKTANLGSGWFGHFIVTLPRGGEIYALLGAFFAALGNQFNRMALKNNVPSEFANIFRTFVGSILFFFIALIIFGWGHFADLFSPFLWKWMVAFAFVIVALGTYSLNRGLAVVSNDNVAIANAFLPVAGVIFAFLIVHEIPDFAQVIGGIVIIIGIFIGLSDTSSKKIKKRPMGFKGI